MGHFVVTTTTSAPMLIDTPLPPFLEPIQFVDFRVHDEAGYRVALRDLLAALLGRPGQQADRDR